MGLLQGQKGTLLLDIYLDVERDFGRFLLVRTFNNEVADAKRLCCSKEKGVSLSKSGW